MMTRSWKIGLVATTAIVAIAATLVAFRSDNKLVAGTAGAATPNAPFAMPVPVVTIVKKTIPIYLDYSARTESIRSIPLQAKRAAILMSRLSAMPRPKCRKDCIVYYGVTPVSSPELVDRAVAKLRAEVERQHGKTRKK